MDKNYYDFVAELAVKDDEAFIALYNKFFPLVYGMIFARIKDISAVEDVVSEIFMKVTLNLEKYNRKFAFSTWLFAIARNSLADYFRKKSRNRETVWNDFFDLEAPISEQSEEKFLSTESIENLLREIGKLPYRQRKIFELKYWEDLSNIEIAEIKRRLSPLSSDKKAPRAVDILILQKNNASKLIRGIFYVKIGSRGDF